MATKKSAATKTKSHRVAATGDVEVSTYLEIAQRTEAQPVKPVAPPVATAEAIAVLDFGSQYSRLIARRIREQHVYCEILPPNATKDAVAKLNLKGIVLSGGPASVYEPGAPMAPGWVFDAGVPVLGICYGMQLLAHQLGGAVEPARQREYGFSVIHRNPDSSVLFDGLQPDVPVWMSHGDRIDRLPPGFRA
ncbi:MAG: GMP synthase (glutamine-hydrolyzing), partial [SAR202 cluster bacterium]|nr:GMP synthase (glutamine-hydrolyzing) [SAR202 cluster bacterium]